MFHDEFWKSIFCGQKVKVMSHNTLPAWVFALVWVLVSSSFSHTWQRCRSTVSGSGSTPAAVRLLMMRWSWWSLPATGECGSADVSARITAVSAATPTSCRSSASAAPVDDLAPSTYPTRHCTTLSPVPKNSCLTSRPATSVYQVRKWHKTRFAYFSLLHVTMH